jgi:glucose dehydrogenase
MSDQNECPDRNNDTVVHIACATNARTGDLLWKASLGGQVNSGPMSYMVNGKQYVAVNAGSSLFVFALRQ